MLKLLIGNQYVIHKKIEEAVITLLPSSYYSFTPKETYTNEEKIFFKFNNFVLNQNELTTTNKK